MKIISLFIKKNGSSVKGRGGLQFNGCHAHLADYGPCCEVGVVVQTRLSCRRRFSDAEQKLGDKLRAEAGSWLLPRPLPLLATPPLLAT